MKKELIAESLKIEEEYALNIEKLKVKEKELRLRLKDLMDGKNDPQYISLLREIKKTKNTLLGLLFLRKELKYSLRKGRLNKISVDKTMESSILKSLEVNKEEIDKTYLKYKKLLQEKDNYAIKIGREKKSLEEMIRTTSSGALELSEEAFVKELVKVFRSNSFDKMYDTYDEYLGYSIGQIFIIKYALNNLVQYLEPEDISLNMRRIMKILSNYEFKCEGKVKTYQDFLNCLKSGNIYMCNFSRTSLSYQQALYLYKRVASTFHLPRELSYSLKRRLK